MYREQLEAYFQDKQDMLVDAVCRLVSIDSVEGEPAPGAPFGPGPAAALEEGLKLAQEWGLITQNHEGYVGTADLCDKEDALHILGHLDVVAPGEGWTVTQPYQPKVVDGLIYGRGTDDDKGPVVASLLAMKAVKDLGVPLKSNCRLIMGTNEESGSGDIAWYFARHPFA
ncbi:M20/M25/M40 family metallo-hydrolase, partial [Pseudoflavonifractor sp. An187]